MKQSYNPFAFAAGAFLVLAFAACTSSNSDSATTKQTSSSDTLQAAGAPTVLTHSDSFFVSEPAAFAVTDSHFYVADAGTSSILVYDRSGSPVTRIGRRGRGPGEFIAPSAFALLDSGARMGVGELAVVDAALKRISIVDPQLTVRRTISMPGLAMSVIGTPSGLLLGVQDPIAKTSVAFVNTSDSTSRSFGPMPGSLLLEPQLAASYPFSVVSSAGDKILVGFTGSPWLYQLKLDGTVLDSVNPAPKRRRGVPEDLGERLRKSTSPENEAASTSMLIMLAPLSQFRTAMIHMDFVVEGQSVTGKAFMSVLGSDMRSLCTDAIVPLESDTRPMFAFHNDTLFVVQNAIANGDRVTTKVTSFLNCGA